ncbi:MAG: sulfoxide reductase heme-binding subunit YedZ [Rhodocyclaceae bacterium]|nr:sulfoxide reductase heme-binding subunit YedZ [Rhodocyclaceae bacterium]
MAAAAWIPRRIAAPGAGMLTAVKCLVFAACLLPLADLLWAAWRDDLGANPIEAITRGLGTWTLNFLLITLSVTPLRKLSGLDWLVRLRRMLGLYAFFYASLHLLTYLWLDQFFDWAAIVKDIAKRPFVTAGFLAWLMLVPLAATSTQAMMRRLGGRRWQRLHRSVYAIGVVAVLHYWWLVKKDVTLPFTYALILGALLAWRAVRRQDRGGRANAALVRTPGVAMAKSGAE